MVEALCRHNQEVGRDVEVIAAEARSITNAELVARYPLVAPGECSIVDEHYAAGFARARARAVRARSASE